ncbi:tetratricopeptide repeat protein [Streptomyces sp. NPDC051567]|uniref:tetratricopeptide repeat protein n=1 Tax=Streptomyces sp. NPDC051567 TaxID=3365660 RepID=UPI0037AAFDC7
MTEPAPGPPGTGPTGPTGTQPTGPTQPTSPTEPTGAGPLHTEAHGHAQQAVIGQGVQHNYFYGASGAARPGVVLSTLVPPPSILVGHAGRLASLTARCRSLLTAGGSTALALFRGPGGCGKSALARALAAGLAGEFTDARLEVDLAGFTPGTAPRDPGEVLAELLRLAGFTGSDIPTGTAAKGQLWRAWTAGKRVLLLLDNARERAQVEPLLPAPSTDGRCLVLVTSRNRLDGLDAAVHVGVGPLPPEAAVELLLRVAGHGPGEPAGRERELADLARLCGYLPLALRPVGALLADLDPRVLLRVMRSATRPLEQLDDADREAAAAFAVSYEALSADLQRVLRTCVWHPGPDFDADSIGALGGMAPELATVQLVRLLQRSMLTRLPQHRYVFHDLFLAYARMQLAAQDPRETVAAGRSSLYRHLDRVIGTAHALVYGAGEPTIGTGPFDNPDHARLWMGAAAGELAGAARAALTESWELGGGLAARTAKLLYVEGHDERAGALYEEVLAAAGRAGDERARALALTALGDIERSARRFEAAVPLFEEAVRVLAGLGEPAAEADAWRGLGETARARGDLDEAVAHFGAALARAGDADDPAGQGYALTGLAHVARVRGDLTSAGRDFGRAVEVQRRADDGIGLAYALRGLGHVERAAGDLDAADRHFREAMGLHQRAGNRFGQAYALTALGGIARESGRPEEAAVHLGDALVLHRAVNNPAGEAQAYGELAKLARAGGDEAAALAHEAAAATLVPVVPPPGR